MSPTENDLRAALRDGEGDGPDPFVVAAAGRRAQARRRSQLVNTAAAVVLIGALGAGGTLLARGGGDDGQAGGSQDLGAAHAPVGVDQQSAAGAANGELNNGGSSTAPAGGAKVAPSPATPAASSCPATAPAVPAPGGASSAGPLFRTVPAGLVVCTYAGAVGSSAPDEVVLTGADARAVLASLDAASTTRPTGMCPNYRIAGERTLEIIGLDAAGAPVGTVTTTLDRPSCATIVTNGKAVRYGWTPPKPLLQKVGPLGGRSHGPVAAATSPSR